MIRGQIISPHLPDDEQISLVSDILAVPSERLQLVADRLPDYQMRPLSSDERVAWLAEVAPQGDLHRRHVAAVILKMRHLLPDQSAELDRIIGEESSI